MSRQRGRRPQHNGLRTCAPQVLAEGVRPRSRTIVPLQRLSERATDREKREQKKSRSERDGASHKLGDK